MSAISKLADRAMKEENYNEDKAKEIFKGLLEQFPDVKKAFMEKAEREFYERELDPAASRMEKDKNPKLGWVVTQALMASKGDEEKAIEHLVFLADRNPQLGTFIENALATEELAETILNLKAKIYREIAKRLPKGKTVREVFSEQDLIKIIENTGVEMFGECPPNLMEMLLPPEDQE